MLLGILVLIYLGRDTARLMNGPLGEIELMPLLATDGEKIVRSPTGKVVVLHFWGTWCPTCRKELTEFLKMQKKLEAKSEVVVLPISCSQSTSESLEELRTTTKTYLESIGVDVPIYADPNLFTRGRITKMLAAEDSAILLRWWWISKASSATIGWGARTAR